MSHVDEGLLHAYLDGALHADDPVRADAVAAHIDACDDCRARLEQAAALRAEADALIELAVPGELAMPPFEEIAARAETVEDGETQLPRRVPATRPASVAWTRRLAWAASVVIALGMGWWARDLAYDPASPVSGLDRQTPSAPEPAEAVLMEGQEQPAAREAVEEPVPAAGRVVEAAPAGETEAAGRGQATVPERQPAATGPVEEPRARQAVEPVVQGEEEAPAVAEALARPALRQAVIERPRREDEPERTFEDRAVSLDAVVVHGIPGPAAKTLESWLGGPLWAVQGLPHEARDTLNIDGLLAVRITQTLPDGGSIQLVQFRPTPDGGGIALVQGYLAGGAAAEPARRERLEAAAPAGVLEGRTTTLLDGTAIVAVAPLPADSIAVLLQSLERLP